MEVTLKCFYTIYEPKMYSIHKPLNKRRLISLDVLPFYKREMTFVTSSLHSGKAIPLRKVLYSNRKEFALHEKKFLPFRIDLKRGHKISFDIVVSLEKVFIPF